MDDLENIPESDSPDKAIDPLSKVEGSSIVRPSEGGSSSQAVAPDLQRTATAAREDAAARRRKFLRNLTWLLSLGLAAFVLTAWIMVRLDGPYNADSVGPQEIVRAQLRALDHGQLRPAYDMFSARYRTQVSYDAWRELVLTHSRMFHADVVRAGTPAQTGAGVNLEIFLHGADDKDYRARFSLIRTEGRWWIDDVHWTEAPDEHDVWRI